MVTPATTLSHIGDHIGVLLRATPQTAARYGLLALVQDCLETARSPLADQMHQASAELRQVLEVDDLYGVAPAMAAFGGRPRRAVVAALRAPELVTALCRAIDELDLGHLYSWAEAWGPQEAGGVVPLSADGWAARSELTDVLRARVRVLVAEWRRLGVELRPEARGIDGRSVAAAARLWQVPMITGTLLEPPVAAAARYPNRAGKAAAAVAYSRLNAAITSLAPDEDVVEPLALLIAVGESISVAEWQEQDRAAALRGHVRVRVPGAEDPVPDTALSVVHWWPVFASWGSSVKREAQAVPTAWRLSDAEADVLVWALGCAAARLAVAASMSAPVARGAPRKHWASHVSTELPKWAAGAESAWLLMQTVRDVSKRTAWPGCIAPRLEVASSWPWRPSPTHEPDTLGAVPDAEEV